MFGHLPAVLSQLPSRLLLSSTRTLTGARHGQRTMELAIVRCVPGEQMLRINYRLHEIQRDMLRHQDEKVGKVLARISNNSTKVKNPKKASKPPSETKPLPLVQLLYNGEPVADTLPNRDAWQDGAVLQVGDIRFLVQRNLPTVNTLKIPASLMSGFPIFPSLEVEFADPAECEFTWFRESDPKSSPEPRTQPRPIVDSWTEVGRGKVYIPSEQDIGCQLKLCCVARNGKRAGLVKEATSCTVVVAGPEECTFDKRHMHTVREAEWPVLRVVSYNILANVYVETGNFLPHCNPAILDLEYRQNLIKKELAGYNADIICLQEVDKAVFSESLTPAMDTCGLDGVFKIKARQHEGLATFFRRSKFRLLSSHDIKLGTAFVSDPIHSELLEKVSTCCSALTTNVETKTTVLQVSLLEDLNKPGRKVCVANIHLYWHPEASNVRLVQISVALQHLRHVIDEFAPGAPLIFCGDFNSTPFTDEFKLLSKAEVSRQDEEWNNSTMNLVSAFPPLLSACGEPEYTNYVATFNGCLDYIFIQPNIMQVEQMIELPSHQEVTMDGALPSAAHPSDHISLVCDLRWEP